LKFSDSLKKTSDFSLCYEEGKSISDHFIVLYVRENGTDFNHLGISVSKKVGNSVIRHHLARLIRESYRLHEDEFRPGLDIVVIVRRSGRNASFSQIESSLLNLASLHNIIRK
jgi:ribonuclease P protein component